MLKSLSEMLIQILLLCSFTSISNSSHIGRQFKTTRRDASRPSRHIFRTQCHKNFTEIPQPLPVCNHYRTTEKIGRVPHHRKQTIFLTSEKASLFRIQKMHSATSLFLLVAFFCMSSLAHCSPTIIVLYIIASLPFFSRACGISIHLYKRTTPTAISTNNIINALSIFTHIFLRFYDK